MLACLLPGGWAGSAADAPMGVERIARFSPHGYVFKSAGSNDAIQWVQVDLGKSVKIDLIKVLPLLEGYGTDAPGFPVRFKLEAAQLWKFFAILQPAITEQRRRSGAKTHFGGFFFLQRR